MRVTKPPHERRAELVRAARVLFDEKGVAQTRVSDIVKRVGVAQGVFYYYFKSKDEMVRAVVGQVAAEVDGVAEGILKDESSSYYNIVCQFLNLIADVVDKFLADSETRLPPADPVGAHSPTGEIAVRLRRHLGVLVERGVREGCITAEYPQETVDILLYGLRALAERQLPDARLVYTVTEQAMGLPKGSLTRCPEENP